MVLVFVISVVPAAGKTVTIGSEVGKPGSIGEPVPFFTTAPSVYFVVVGLVTVPTTVPPPITIFPFTSILPVKLSLMPAEKAVAAKGVILLAAVILPSTMLLLAKTTLPPL